MFILRASLHFSVYTNSVQLGSMVKINTVKKKILLKGFNFNIKCLRNLKGKKFIQKT